MDPQFRVFWEIGLLSLGFLCLTIIGGLAIIRPGWLKKSPVLPPNTGKICLILATIGLPFLAFATAGLSIQAIWRIAAVGALLGLLAAPLMSWYFAKKFGKLGFFRVIGIFLLTIVSASWGVLCLVSWLIVMTSD